MPNQGKHGKARAAAAEAREDIISSIGHERHERGRVTAMGTVGAAVIKLHKETLNKKPEWFWHLFAKCEAEAQVSPIRPRTRRARMATPRSSRFTPGPCRN